MSLDPGRFPHPHWRAAHIAPRTFRAATLPAPPSKAASLRALFFSSIAATPSLVEGFLPCRDTRAMRDALHVLGARFREGAGGAIEVIPLGNPLGWPAGRVIPLGESGVTARFLLALAALAPGPTTLRGDPSLRRRPMGPLAAALRRLGARVEALGREGHLPLRVTGPIHGGRVRVEASGSSQHASALVAVGGLLPGGLHIALGGRPVSRPYLDLTCRMLRARGMELRAGPCEVVVRPGRPRATRTRIGGDPSAAAFGWAAGALTKRAVTLRGRFTGPEAEGDLAFLDLLRDAGCHVRRQTGAITVWGPPRRGIRADLRDHPDLAPPLAAVLAHAPGRSTLLGLSHLRAKESDRIASVAGQWRRLGFGIRARAASLLLDGGGSARLRGGAPPTAFARGDHRIAMAVSILGLVPASPGIVLRGPRHVAKTAPGFFEWIAPLARVHGIP